MRIAESRNMNLPAIITALSMTVVIACAAHATLPSQLRVATYNVALSNHRAAGDLAARLSGPTDPQARFSAEVVQRVDPDVLLLNEFDFDADGQSIGLYQQNYLGVSQNGQAPVTYDYAYFAPVNTGLQPETVNPAWDFDFNNNGRTDDPEDAFGFGNYEGQFGMVILSKYPILEPDVRTFQSFRWTDMPGNVMPEGFFSEAERSVFRLSSKSHWDVPIDVGGHTVHLLASHPTPPVFDDPSADENGRRNHDEIRFWADYVTPGTSDYIYDDNGMTGGLAAEEAFVILGDQNADPDEGDSFNNAIDQLLNNPFINSEFTPTGAGGEDSDDTAEFGLRADYVLPSSGLNVTDGGVFWPDGSTAGATAANFASDHRLVYLDLVVPEPGAFALLY